MQAPERFSNLPEYAFPRLRALLDPIQPGPQGENREPVAMSLGEPRHPLPDFLEEALRRHNHLYAKYPPNEGAPELREACAAWANRRYGLGGRIDPDVNVFPLNGTREGHFAACVALSPATSKPSSAWLCARNRNAAIDPSSTFGVISRGTSKDDPWKRGENPSPTSSGDSYVATAWR